MQNQTETPDGFFQESLFFVVFFSCTQAKNETAAWAVGK